MTPQRITQARALYDAGELTVQEIAGLLGVSRPTIYRHLDPPAPGVARLAPEATVTALSAPP